MPLTFRCPACERALSAPDGAEGRAATCPGCGHRFAVPGGASMAPPPPRPETEAREPAFRPVAAEPSPPSSDAPTFQLEAEPQGAPTPVLERRPPSYFDEAPTYRPPRPSPWPKIIGLAVVVGLVVGVIVYLKNRPDPFVGKWEEHWPGVRVHDVNIVTYEDGKYRVRVINPAVGAEYTISNVRREGRSLKFTEDIHPFNRIDYEVRPKDRDTLSVRVRRGGRSRSGILWKRLR